MESNQSNKRLIERSKKKIEDEQFREIPRERENGMDPPVNSCTLYRNFSVEMEETLETDKQRMNIDKLNEDVQKAEKR